MALIKIYAIIDKRSRRGKSPKSTIQGETTEIDNETLNSPKAWKKERQRIMKEFFNKLRGKPNKLKQFIYIDNLPKRTETWKDGKAREVPRNTKGQFTGKIKIK